MNEVKNAPDLVTRYFQSQKSVSRDRVNYVQDDYSSQIKTLLQGFKYVSIDGENSNGIAIEDTYYQALCLVIESGNSEKINTTLSRIMRGSDNTQNKKYQAVILKLIEENSELFISNMRSFCKLLTELCIFGHTVKIGELVKKLSHHFDNNSLESFLLYEELFKLNIQKQQYSSDFEFLVNGGKYVTSNPSGAWTRKGIPNTFWRDIPNAYKYPGLLVEDLIAAYKK